MSIVRYRLVKDSTMGPYHLGHAEGEWVRWADVQAALQQHEERMAALPTIPRPQSPAEGLRALAVWFAALYPEDNPNAVAEDLSGWADRLAALEQAAKQAAAALVSMADYHSHDIETADFHALSCDCRRCDKHRRLREGSAALAALRDAGEQP